MKGFIPVGNAYHFWLNELDDVYDELYGELLHDTEHAKDEHGSKPEQGIGGLVMKTKVLAGALWRDEEGLYLESMIDKRYRLVVPQTLTLADTQEKVHTDELRDYHYGMYIIAVCEIP